LVLLCAGATASSRTGAFPAPDEPLDESGRRKAGERLADVSSVDRVLISPARAARETASALMLDGIAEAALTDIDHGAWSGRTLTDLHAAEPEALTRWFADPTAGAPSGETMATVIGRVGPWLDLQAASQANILAITHSATIRAILAYALHLPVTSTLQIDIAPLSMTVLSFNRIWRLQELKRP
jgi:broad specificity phosphatase PhoE